MKKRILSCVLALVLVLGLMPAALGAAASDNEAAQVLAALDIMVGDQNGNLNLGAAVTRAEFTKLVMAASPQRKSVGESASVSPYPDVPKSHWAAPYVQAAVEAGYVTGYLDGTFRPGSIITLAEGVTMVLRLLGYQNSDFSGRFPAGQMAAYRNLKLDAGVTAAEDGAMTRRDAMYLFYNLLTAKTKGASGTAMGGESTAGASYYLNTLEPGLVNARGEIDMVALVNSAMEGPVVAESGWQSAVPFDVNGAKVYRNGAAAALSAVQSLDVVYYSKSMRSIWAYSTQVTGTYESAAPSPSAPTSITVAGKTYAIESTSAAFDLSDLGPYKVGDSVTLLLGRDGGVAAVRGAGTTAAREVYGVVVAAENKSYTDNKGGTYTSYSITLHATDGSQPTYAVDTKTFKAGDLVRVIPGESGVQVKRLSSASLTGKVSSDGAKLGNYPFASDARILDVSGKTDALRIYPSRLAGVNLRDNMVKFYLLNAQGEITDLILDDVTGDLYRYGVMTGVDEQSGPDGFSMYNTYKFDLGGVEYGFTSTSVSYGVRVGPCQIKGFASAAGATMVDKMSNLTEVKLESVDGSTAVAQNNRKYTLSDAVAVYVVENGSTYLYSSLSRVSGGGYTLTGYYDKAESDGGRIRVILARAA